MLKGSEIRRVHLEVTDKCNASCPMCARNINGGKLNPNLRLIEMSLSDAQKIFRPEFLNQLEFIQLCGNFGDPIAAKDTLEILQYFRSVNPKITLGIHTNGGLKSTDWWASLGGLLSQAGDYCKFGLDGLSDTNHIYRRNTNWDKIMANAKSFIEAGGIAHWEFLVFRHNEHQVEEARQLAEEMGFKAFYVKRTSRFFDYHSGQNVAFPILDKDGAQVGVLEPPTNEDFVNPVSVFANQKSVENLEDKVVGSSQRSGEAIKKSASLRKLFGSLDQYFKKASVDCMNQGEKSIYITVRGEVYPCCFLAGQVRYSDPGVDGKNLERMIHKIRGGEAGLSALESPVGDVADSGWFASIEQNWKQSGSSSSTIQTCRRMCGSHLKLVSAEYK